MHQHLLFVVVVICVCRDDNYYNDKHINCQLLQLQPTFQIQVHYSELRLAIMMSIVFLWIYCLLASGPTTCAHMQSSGTQATSVKAAVLAGLGIAAPILLL